MVGGVFIDWDLAALGRRSWDLSLALLSLVPLMPNDGFSDQRAAERLAVFARAYGAGDLPADVLTVAGEPRPQSGTVNVRVSR